MAVQLGGFPSEPIKSLHRGQWTATEGDGNSTGPDWASCHGLKGISSVSLVFSYPDPLLSHRLCQSLQQRGSRTGVHHPNCAWHWVTLLDSNHRAGCLLSLFLFSLSLILADHVPEAELNRGFTAWSGVFQAFIGAAQVSQGTQSQLSMAACFTTSTRILPRWMQPWEAHGC